MMFSQLKRLSQPGKLWALMSLLLDQKFKNMVHKILSLSIAPIIFFLASKLMKSGKL